MEQNNNFTGPLSTWYGCNSSCCCGNVLLRPCNGEQHDMMQCSRSETQRPSCPDSEDQIGTDDQALVSIDRGCQCHEKIEALQKQIETQKDMMHHLEIHCYLYQQAVINVKQGVRIWQETADQWLKGPESRICHHCGTEKLLQIIAQLQQRVATLKAMVP